MAAAVTAAMVDVAPAVSTSKTEDPNVVRTAIAAMAATGRPALVEMRRVVGVLRHPDMIDQMHGWSERIRTDTPIGATTRGRMERR